VQLRLAALAVAVLAGEARADGVLSLRGAYYKERSTRVQQPMVDATFDTGENGQVRGHFLVDSITSASAATGAGGVEFTELRYEFGLGYSHRLPRHVTIGAQARFSTESDYSSLFAAGHVELALFDQTTTVRALFGRTADQIDNGVSLMMGSLGTPPREESLATTMASLGVAQVLGPRVVASVTYDLIHMSGYQANIYRVVRGGTEPVPERVPEERLRHAVAASVRVYLPTRTTAIAAYRFYADDWGIVAHTPEARVIQEIVPGLDARARYRFFTQTAADFWKPVYMQSELVDPAAFVTDDEKLSPFTTHTFGGQLSGALRLLGIGGGWGDLRIDVIVERVLQDNAFGNAWVGGMGLTVPFAY
jgi:hypothetical protein